MSMNENCLCVLVVTKTTKVSVSGVGLGLDLAGLGLGLGLGLPGLGLGLGLSGLGLGLGLGLSGLGLGLPGLDNISGLWWSIVTAWNSTYTTPLIVVSAQLFRNRPNYRWLLLRSDLSVICACSQQQTMNHVVDFIIIRIIIIHLYLQS